MASLSVIAQPYARAIFELARDEGQFQAWGDQLALAVAIVDNPEMKGLLDSPRITAQQLGELFLDIGGDKFNSQFQNLLRILAENRRLSILPSIAEAYQELRAEAEKVLHVKVTSAAPMSDAQKQAMSEKLKQRFSRDIKAEYAVDEELIGGAVVRAGDTVIDGSLRNKLARLADVINNG